MAESTRRKWKANDEVYWTDPDRGLSSGRYTIDAILSESGQVEEDDTIILIRNAAGSSAEVFAHELS